MDIVEKKTGTGNDLKSMTVDELKDWVTSVGQPAFRAKQIYQWFQSQIVHTGRHLSLQ